MMNKVKEDEYIFIIKTANSNSQKAAIKTKQIREAAKKLANNVKGLDAS
jgi:hypothetical protein